MFCLYSPPPPSELMRQWAPVGRVRDRVKKVAGMEMKWIDVVVVEAGGEE